MGIWVENDAYVPKPADAILYDWDDSGSGDNTGTPEHIGTVEKVEGSLITVIEGNYSNAVKRRVMEVNGRYIRGYICPKYDDDGSSSGSTSSGSAGSSSGKPSYKVGTTYTLVADALRVRTGAGTNYAAKSYSQLTANAKQNAYSNGCLKKGTRVTCQEVKTVGSDVWIRIPSGWIAAYYQGEKYVN